jgi:hypothetical protein
MKLTIKHIDHFTETITYRDLLGNIHREDGPAVITTDSEEWWVSGIYYPTVHSIEELIIKQILE